MRRLCPERTGMTEKQGPTSYEGNEMDMKELLQGVSSEEDLELEAILAEYGGKKKEDEFTQLRSEPDAETCEPAPAAVETEDLDRISPEEMFGMEGIGKAELLPETYYMLQQLPALADYNKILASYVDGVLYLVIAQGKTLLLCNNFQAPDFTTAQYFIFLAMKKLQLNPEVSTICFRTPLAEDDEMSLYRYFKSVEVI